MHLSIRRHACQIPDLQGRLQTAARPAGERGDRQQYARKRVYKAGALTRAGKSTDGHRGETERATRAGIEDKMAKYACTIITKMVISYACTDPGGSSTAAATQSEFD